jgi:hypothetical protein
MKTIVQNSDYNPSYYAIPLNIDINGVQQLFEIHYAEKKDVFLNSYPMLDLALNLVPKELHEYLVTDRLWIGYFHNQRRSKQFIPIHLDNHHDNIKFPCSINIPILGCNEQITTSFWEPVDDVVGKKMKRSEAYHNGELTHAYEFALTDTPVLFNNQKWHSVFNPMPQMHERAIMIFKFNNNETDWKFFRELTQHLV